MKKKRYTKDDLFCRYCGRTHPTKRERDRCQNECRKKERDAWNEENLGLCYITCPICGKCVSVLLRHVKRTHGMSKEEFKRLYPDMKTITNEARKNYSKSNSEETRKKISESNKGRTSPMKGKHLSEERIKRMSELMKGNQHLKGHVHSEETKQKMSEAQKRRRERERTKKQTNLQDSGNANTW